MRTLKIQRCFPSVVAVWISRLKALRAHIWSDLAMDLFTRILAMFDPGISDPLGMDPPVKTSIVRARLEHFADSGSSEFPPVFGLEIVQNNGAVTGTPSLRLAFIQ